MPTKSRHVRVRGQSGKHMLGPSASQFDPKPTSRWLPLIKGNIATSPTYTRLADTALRPRAWARTAVRCRGWTIAPTFATNAWHPDARVMPRDCDFAGRGGSGPVVEAQHSLHPCGQPRLR